jgi:hypothetical protein
MDKELEDKIKKNWSGINFYPTLDAHEDRRKALEFLRDRIFSLVWWYNKCLCDDHPVRHRKNKEEMRQIFDELCWRFQDYEVFMYDYQKDWDLNYQDYGLDKIYEKE